MSKAYRAVVAVADRFVPSKLRPLWEHDAGPKTVFFWAPAFKWVMSSVDIRPPQALHGRKALVVASLDEYRRPLGKVSTTQSATLAATGFIWTRYCLVIRPINYSLSICNFSLGLANAVQCLRAHRYQRAVRMGAV